MTRLLGAGAFAWVYEAIDRDLEIPVALKILRPEYAGVAAAETRFRKEATTAARLRHPNIVTVRDVGMADGAVFVAMDLLPLSLARRLEVLSRLPETEVVRFALDVAAALSIAHADGIVHRDIKPDNVLLGANGEAIVADFGLAGAFANDHAGDPSRSPTNEVQGTPHYFSPEQARGLDVDGRADLYALGVTCYRAATGKLPFEGDDWYTVAKQHIEDTAVSPRTLVPELTEGFDAIVMKLLAKEPEKRFASATQLADALLVLPTAPSGRGINLVPTAVTQISAPYVHALVPLPKRSMAKRAAAGALAVSAIAVAALFALPTTNSFSLRPLIQSAPPTVAPAPFDSAQPPNKDSVVMTVTDTSKSVVAPVVPPKRTGNATASNASARAHIEFVANDSAQLWVDDVLMGRGKWTGDFSIGRPHHFRASLEGSVDACTSAHKDTAVTFATAQPTRVDVNLSPCGVLALTVKSQDADYTLTGRDFESTVNGKYTGKTTLLVLRAGFYELKVRMDRCTPYTDTITIVGSSSASEPMSRSVSPYCN